MFSHLLPSTFAADQLRRPSTWGLEQLKRSMELSNFKPSTYQPTYLV